jgi:hypothetical protein
MAFDFPSNPSIGQIYAAHGVTYAYSGYAWNAIGGVIDDGDVLPDGDRGDIIITGGIWHFDPAVVTDAARTLLDDVSVEAMQMTLQLNNVDNTSDLSKPVSTATQAAIDANAALINNKVAKAGDTMTGGLSIQRTNAPGILTLQNLGTIEHTGFVTFARGSFARWNIGSNPGADDLAFYRYADDGTYLGQPMLINRLTGNIQMAQNLGVSGNLSVSGAISCSGAIATGSYLTTNGGVLYMNAGGSAYHHFDGTNHIFRPGALNSGNGLIANGPITAVTALNMSGLITAQHIWPVADNTYYCGHPSYRWYAVYAVNGVFTVPPPGGGGPGLLTANNPLLLAVDDVPIMIFTPETEVREGETPLIHVGCPVAELEASFAAQGLDPTSYNFYNKTTNDQFEEVVHINYVELLLMQVRSLQERVKLLESYWAAQGPVVEPAE